MMLLGIGEAGREWGALSGVADAATKLALVYIGFVLAVGLGLGALTTLLRWRGWHRCSHYSVTAAAAMGLWVLSNRIPLPTAQLPASIIYAIAAAALAGLCGGLYWWIRRPDLG